VAFLHTFLSGNERGRNCPRAMGHAFLTGANRPAPALQCGALPTTAPMLGHQTDGQQIAERQLRAPLVAAGMKSTPADRVSTTYDLMAPMFGMYWRDNASGRSVDHEATLTRSFPDPGRRL